MRKLLSLILCITIIFTFAAGCGQDKEPVDEPQDAQTDVADEAVESAPEVLFTFDPKAVSGYWKEIFGDTMVQTWYNLVDAVLAGEDTFECPDQFTLDWVLGQFPEKCFPVLVDLIAIVGECEDGQAHIYYLTSREEFDEKLNEFEKQVENILNTAMKADYSDLEKALSLYRYFYETYEYDYETYEKKLIEAQEQVRCYRLFKEGTGICQELSTAYSFLLTQAGVDATIMMSGDHAWSYVRINGKNYHIDPTFVLDDDGYLGYFMMTDEQRLNTYDDSERRVLASTYTQEFGGPEYTADDDSFSPIWDSYLVDFDHDKHLIHSYYFDDHVNMVDMDFDYEGF